MRPIEENPAHVFVQGDIGDAALVGDLLKRHRPRAVLNFAAETHVDRSILGADPFVETNVAATVRLLEAVRSYWRELPEAEGRLFRFLHVSTDEVFGSLEQGAPGFSDTTPYGPNSPYSASKAAGDHFVRAYHHTHGLPVLTSNCSNNYGPLQFPEKLIPLMINNALEGKPLPVYGDGLQIRDWLYVEDHCRALEAVLEGGRPGETYNIGGRSEMPNIEVVQKLCGILDRLAPDSPHRPHATLIAHVEDRPGHDRRYAIDDRKIRTELGWKPEETFASGMGKTVAWYLDNPEWVAQVRSGGYRDWIRANYDQRLAKA